MPRDRVFLKFRDRQRGDEQYQASRRSRCAVRGARRRIEIRRQSVGLRRYGFVSRSSQYAADGSRAAGGKQVLNLFAYTGSFTVYAAAGGAADHDNRRQIVDLHGLGSREFGTQRVCRSGSTISCAAISSHFLDGLRPSEKWDLAVVDPPTFSNTKGLRSLGTCSAIMRRCFKHLAAHIVPGGMRVFQHEFPAIQVRRGGARRLFGSRHHAANDSRRLSQRANSQVLATCEKNLADSGGGVLSADYADVHRYGRSLGQRALAVYLC